MLNYETLKKLLFLLDPEVAHHLAECGLRIGAGIGPLRDHLEERHFVEDSRLFQELFGTYFRNPVGLGAGYDKNGTMIRAMKMLGFGFTELGTVTPRPQPGNPRPRLFRHVEAKSIQNAMGFNNEGGYALLKRLNKALPVEIPVGANIGKNKTTPNSEAIFDYVKLYRLFGELCDYVVVNFSSPNTKDLRSLQNKEFLEQLFGRIGERKSAPVLIKIAPDMASDEAIRLCEDAVTCGADGVIIANTSIDYSLLESAKDFGGLSGAVIREKSFEIFKAVAQELYGKTLLVSCGGIDSPKEAYRRIRHGASLVQVYTALIFEGPELVADINRGILELMNEDRFNHLSEAIGAEWRVGEDKEHE